ncbi:c-type cytochrome [Pacificitalea manganoxidans]|nr:cytochrome c [Pacificitalea manganoxidans]MDR6309220.1 cytochrome c556 [Pacificitalea manganoxidans]|tara:strand:+ start:361 stop:813 length:453 start_codon:yes stop_codon:yes gene_type:complete
MTRSPRSLILAVSVIALGAGAALAEAHMDPIEARQQAMKTVGASTKTLAQMANGTNPFDATAAETALSEMQAAVADFATYFPDGSESDESEAAPAIFSDRDGFEEQVAEFQADIDTALETPPSSQDELKVAFGNVAGNCKACHETYRVDK